MPAIGHRFLVLVIVFAHSISCEITDQPKGYNIGNVFRESAKSVFTSKILKSATETDKKLLNDFSSFLQESVHPLLLDYLAREDSIRCLKDLRYVFESARLEEWARKMLDSFAKPESGLLFGNTRWVGEFEECLEVYAPTKAGDTDGFHGKYCSLEFQLQVKNMTVALTVGLCLPSSCNPSGTLYDEPENRKASDSVPTFGHKLDSVLNTTRLTCQPLSIGLTASAIVVICVICIFLLLALIGTSITVYGHFTQSQAKKNATCLSINPENSPILGEDYRGCYDPISEDEQNRWIQGRRWTEKVKLFLNCFCVLTNGKKLLNASNNGGQMLCIHGIRFLSITWVIYCHTYGLGFFGTRNLAEAVEMMDDWPYEIIKNGFYSVDAFFLLSGFLLSTLFFEEYSKKNGRISWLYFYTHRFIRLTPVYMVIIAVYTHLSPYLTSGPVRAFFEADKTCLDSWWWNLLYINNFRGQTDQCMAWSWYLANDMQFYVISPLFLVSICRWPKIGLSLICIFFCLTFASSFALTYAYDLISGIGDLDLDPGLPIIMSTRWDDFFRILYIKPYGRIGPYLVGIVLGYLLFRRKQEEKRKLNWVILSTGWVISSGITLACLFGLYNQHFSVLTRSFYNAFHRTCFAGGLAWVIYICLTGQGSFVNRVLSWKAWIPFSRLTYCAYLVHPFVQLVYYTSVKRLLEYSFTTWVFLYLGFLIVTFIVALVVSLLFESPILKVEKLIRSTIQS